MKWLRHRGEVMVAGTNARMMRLLNVSPTPARALKAETVESVVERYSKEALNEETLSVTGHIAADGDHRM